MSTVAGTCAAMIRRILGMMIAGIEVKQRHDSLLLCRLRLQHCVLYRKLRRIKELIPSSSRRFRFDHGKKLGERHAIYTETESGLTQIAGSTNLKA